MSDFSPADLTDGRVKGDWKSRYEDEKAIKAIRWEKKYLIFVFVFSIIIPAISGIILKCIKNDICIEDSSLIIYFFAWWGGSLGGCVYSAKWLIHSVAKHNWNIDRQLWRILTPHLSGALALIIVILINSGVEGFSTSKSLDIPYCYSIGFLTGYFSDNAIGKLAEIAQVLFGSSLSQKK